MMEHRDIGKRNPDWAGDRVSEGVVMIYLLCTMPGRDDSMEVLGVYTTKKRAMNAIKRAGYRKNKNPDIWSPPKDGDIYVAVEIVETKMNKEVER